MQLRAVLVTLFKLLAAVALVVASPAAESFTVDTSPTAVTNVTGLWWNSSESGWGASLTQQGSIVFVAMYTYDASGTPVWYVASNCVLSEATCTGRLYWVTGGHSPTTPWSGASTAVQDVGPLSIMFTDNNNGGMSFSINGVGGAKQITRELWGSTAPTDPPDRVKSEQLLGSWLFAYTIGSISFSDTYHFSTVDTTPDSSGNYFARGTDTYGRQAIGSYSPTLGMWAVLDPGIIIDEFFTFNFNDANDISGCYYQASLQGTIQSSCYPLNGFRTGGAAIKFAGIHSKPSEEELLAAVARDGTPYVVDQAVVDAYLALRRQLQ